MGPVCNSRTGLRLESENCAHSSGLQRVEQIEQIEKYFLTLQDKVCEGFRSTGEEKTFQEELWNHSEGGGGRTRIIEQGTIFERVGVNFSCIQGKSLPTAATLKRPELLNRRFVATGVSVVAHPYNPYIPTSHFNVRFIIAYEQENLSNPPIWWFGGGFDLTPYYPFEEDCIHWHSMAKNACAPFGEEIYPNYKRNCDDYFYLKHRNETRGIGGIFFDDVNHWPFETCFEFIQSVANHFMSAYFPIVEKRCHTPFKEREREFQLYRRGRYIEFNLVYDRGTLFGLQSGGRSESILMSMPPKAHFKYDWRPEPGSAEALLYERYLKPQEWV